MCRSINTSLLCMHTLCSGLQFCAQTNPISLFVLFHQVDKRMDWKNTFYLHSVVTAWCQIALYRTRSLSLCYALADWDIEKPSKLNPYCSIITNPKIYHVYDSKAPGFSALCPWKKHSPRHIFLLHFIDHICSTCNSEYFHQLLMAAKCWYAGML